jgi:hypothetical protein
MAKRVAVCLLIIVMSGLSVFSGCELSVPTKQLPFLINVGGKDVPVQIFKSWSGSSSRTLDFTSEKSPIIVICGVSQTSQIKYSITVEVQGGIGNPYVGSGFWIILATEAHNLDAKGKYTILEGAGRYRIRVESSGCDWWLKVGTE